MKIKLNDNTRSRLRSMVRELVTAPFEADLITFAYARAVPLVQAAIKERYPQKDMKVLEKYQMARKDVCVRVNFTAGGVNEFNFHENDSLLTPGREHYYDCQNRIYNIDELTTEAVADWLKAVEDHKKTIDKKQSDYIALINCSVTLEEVEAIWPRASEVRQAINKTLPVLLSNDVIDRIKADVAINFTAAAE